MHHQPPRQPIRNLDDIQAIEQTPWQQLLRADSTYELLCEAAARQPQRTALRFLLRAEVDRADVSISYRTLIERITQAANAFHHAGIVAGKAVALLLPNLPQTHYALWGAQAAGIASPINPLLDSAHIASIIDATQAEVLVTLAPVPGSDLWDKALDVIERCPSIHTVMVVNLEAYVGFPERIALRALRATARRPQREVRIHSFDKLLAKQNSLGLDSGRRFSPEDICAYFHTGGTTGLPKIACHSHRNEVFVASMLQLLEPQAHVVLCGLPLFHVNGALVTGLGAFCGGWEVVLLTPQGYRGPGVMQHFWHWVERFGATTFSGVPTIYAHLAKLPRASASTATLRHAVCGAAPLPAGVAEEFEQALGVLLCEGYGLTEAACISAFNPPLAARRRGSVGLRLPHQSLQAWKVDASGRASEPCATGEIGVIGISGPNVFPGYLRAADNQGIWLQPGWLNTGDLGYLDKDGYLYLTGRAKDLIIRGGHNIDPAMIEDALQRHPAVALAAAVGQPDQHAGELPVAYVTLKQPSDSETLLQAARALVPERAAIPVRVEILDQLPLTAIGKVAKAELRLRAAEHVLNQALLQQGLDASVRMLADPAKGNLVQLRSSAAASQQALTLLAGYPYPVEVVSA